MHRQALCAKLEEDGGEAPLSRLVPEHRSPLLFARWFQCGLNRGEGGEGDVHFLGRGEQGEASRHGSRPAFTSRVNYANQAASYGNRVNAPGGEDDPCQPYGRYTRGKS